MPGPVRLPVALLLLALGGCAWLRDRAADAADVVTFEVGWGLGLAADVKATDLVHVGVGYSEVRKAGFRGREPRWYRDRDVGLPGALLTQVGGLREWNLHRLLHLHTDVGDALAWEDPLRRADLGAGVTAGLVHLRFELSPGHLLDLLAGLVGLDPAHDDRGLEPEDPAEPGSVWLAGDLHDHCSPPDGSGHAKVSPEETIELARASGLDFVGIQPHLWPEREASDDDDMRAFRARAVPLARAGDQGDGPLVVPGFEVTTRSGHALLLFERVEDAWSDEKVWGDLAVVESARAACGVERVLMVPSHPLTERLSIPFFRDFAGPWEGLGSDPRPGVFQREVPDGLEALTWFHHVFELAVGRTGEALASHRVFAELDRMILAGRRRVVVTGGSDNHRELIVPTMQLLCRARTREAVWEALRQGRVVIGGPEARTLEARTDLEPAWRPIGAALRANRRVELRWSGTGTLVVDGQARPAGEGPFAHEVEPGAFHVYRLEAGPGRRSRSGWIYVNLPE